MDKKYNRFIKVDFSELLHVLNNKPLKNKMRNIAKLDMRILQLQKKKKCLSKLKTFDITMSPYIS